MGDVVVGGLTAPEKIGVELRIGQLENPLETRNILVAELRERGRVDERHERRIELAHPAPAPPPEPRARNRCQPRFSLRPHATHPCSTKIGAGTDFSRAQRIRSAIDVEV
jgi:hypothetical protein